ncbi:MAG: Flp family type IVb pilin [Sphingopyxis sp.]|uniref:Flp family type IVb pilin n=1 Tax=Sphingopyxis sp. TaxID=1908224 RepID=UPI002ABB934B|nr:Flp family type IVb pilin [Sphingopyxis sp.]MDZ3833546.1 Flp family type IVb pilin [Sphingopyxis sp.]
MKFFKKFVRNNKAATAIEYGLIAALIAVAAISALGTLSGGLNGIFTNVGTKLTTEADKAK